MLAEQHQLSFSLLTFSSIVCLTLAVSMTIICRCRKRKKPTFDLSMVNPGFIDPLEDSIDNNCMGNMMDGINNPTYGTTEHMYDIVDDVEVIETVYVLQKPTTTHYINIVGD